MVRISIPSKLYCLYAGHNVIFPGTVRKFLAKSSENIDMIEEHLLDVNLNNHPYVIGVLFKKVYKAAEKNTFHGIGIAALVTKIVSSNTPKLTYQIQLVGLCRINVDTVVQNSPYIVVQASQLDKKSKEYAKSSEIDNALTTKFEKTLKKYLEAFQCTLSYIKFQQSIKTTFEADCISDLLSSIIDINFEEKIKLLDMLSIELRLETLEKYMSEKLNGNSSNDSVVVLKFDSSRKSDQIVQTSKPPDALSYLLTKLKEAKLPAEVEKIVLEDYHRMSSMNTFMYEFSILRSYLELVASLPWNIETKDELDINRARCILDEDHYGVVEIKKRILEYLAVRYLKSSSRSPILCFVGPPGVGKTSIGRSIARAIGRRFQRIALGGICDQSNIRGHRRTYIGSLPGRIINGIKAVQTKNPVFLLDEVDKMYIGSQGDPASALLEVLDPEQNSTFVDHYLNVPFDLSNVLFLATANKAYHIPAALLDRMEIIKLDGYTLDEKIQISEKYLIPKQLAQSGLTSSNVLLCKDILRRIIAEYTWEAGVRNLERKIGSIMRAVALKHVEDSQKSSFGQEKENRVDRLVKIDDYLLEEILGIPEYTEKVRQVNLIPGVAAGLCWATSGGYLLYVEVSKMEGSGKVILTGQLGDVMQESVHIALSWLLSHASTFNLHQYSESENLLDRLNLHIHFPAGAVSKDGPSAGITVLIALVSLFTQTAMRNDTAMTGELTLTGTVLPVGGIKEKVLAAHRHGFSRIILPIANKKDVSKLPAKIQKDLHFIHVEKVDDVINSAFDDGIPKLAANIQSKL